MKKSVFFIILFLAFIFTGTTLYAKITVEATKGEAAYKKGNQWLPLTKGQILQEGAKISTGVKSWAVLNINGDTLRIQQLTMMEIYSNRLTSTDKNTHVGLKHGTLKARVGKIGTLKTSFKISTPVATSSVRGTDEVNKQGFKFGNTVHVDSGSLEVEDRNGVTHTVEGNSTFIIGPNDPRPQNPLANERRKSLVSISDPNTTNDEKSSQELSGLNNFTGEADPGNSVLPNLPAKVNLEVNW
ncbi:MAG: FecR domain-containing protein [Spirochaetes bacterium]|nr:FecR domain-containing protein [Spirochaetota bacterium]